MINTLRYAHLDTAFYLGEQAFVHQSSPLPWRSANDDAYGEGQQPPQSYRVKPKVRPQLTIVSTKNDSE